MSMIQLNDPPRGVVSKTWHAAYAFRYYLLLVALMMMLILPVLSNGQQEGFVWTATRTLVLIACVNVLRTLKHLMLWIILLAVLAVSADWFSFFHQESDYSHISGFIFFGFFVVMISIEVFRKIIDTDQIDMHIIVGAFCGFMLIGMIASLIFTFLHLTEPNSFSNVRPQMDGATDLFYFSFITILTIGYGDIAPQTEEARSISIFFGLVGQFYLVVIMAVLVGKFLSKSGN